MIVILRYFTTIVRYSLNIKTVFWPKNVVQHL